MIAAMSLVLVSPSTVMALKLTAFAAASSSCNSAGSMVASVPRKASMVAMFGQIMPEPLAMPAILAVPPESFTSTPNAFGKVSVVMIASAASHHCVEPEVAFSEGMAPAIFSTGSCWPITPVEATSTSPALRSKACAVDSAISRAFCIPAAPVAALALPLLQMTARILPPEADNAAFDSSTGAAQQRLVVKTEAVLAGSSQSISIRSLLVGLMPQLMPASVKPSGQKTASEAGSATTGLTPSGQTVLLARRLTAAIDFSNGSNLV